MNEKYGAEFSELEKKLKDYIKERYGTVQDFSVKSGIPYSTISTIFKRGILSSNTATVINLCKKLGISTDELAINGNIVPAKSKSQDIEKLTTDYIATVRGAQIVIEGHPLSTSERNAIIHSTQLSLDTIKEHRKELDKALKMVEVDRKKIEEVMGYGSRNISKGVHGGTSRKRSLNRRANIKGAEIL